MSFGFVKENTNLESGKNTARSVLGDQDITSACRPFSQRLQSNTCSHLHWKGCMLGSYNKLAGLTEQLRLARQGCPAVSAVHTAQCLLMYLFGKVSKGLVITVFDCRKTTTYQDCIISIHPQASLWTRSKAGRPTEQSLRKVQT